MLAPVASEERLACPRFAHLFAGGELMPHQVFIAALELGTAETLNGQHLPFDDEVLLLRDELVVAYKPLVGKIRQMRSKEIEDVPPKPVANFARAWTAFESAWLRNREVHAVHALQPLAKAILSLEPLLLSVEKERLLPWPRVKHQKVVTLKALEGFIHSLAELSATVLPSLCRELNHDPKLLLLMDHVLSLRGERSMSSCLDGASATPEVTFPDHHVLKNDMARSASPALTASGLAGEPGKGLALDAYAFRLLGASVGDAVASGKLKATSGNGQAGRAKLAMSGTALETAQLRGPGISHETAAGGAKETDISKRSAAIAEELLLAFENIKDLLLSLKSTLEHVDAALDRDQTFVAMLRNFERSFKRAKKLFLEPDNLA
uniref:Uncharacterized protein n=1 Tax=Zooxanthella nutricula TaxID=1333877 RepID=A0A7S2L351_9DINO